MNAEMLVPVIPIKDPEDHESARAMLTDMIGRQHLHLYHLRALPTEGWVLGWPRDMVWTDPNGYRTCDLLEAAIHANPDPTMEIRNQHDELATWCPVKIARFEALHVETRYMERLKATLEALEQEEARYRAWLAGS